MSNEQTDKVLWSSITGEQLEQCRILQDQMNLNSIQMEKLIIFIAVLDNKQKMFSLTALVNHNVFFQPFCLTSSFEKED
jgi:hypothetical protein